MAEISDQELATAQGLAQLFSNINKNPQARESLEAAIKALDPSVRTSKDVADEITKPYREQIEALNKRLDDRDAREADEKRAAEEREAQRQLDEGFARLRNAGLTEEGEEKVKALMKERTIPDPEAAFALFQRHNPPPPPEQASWRPQAWDLEGDAVADSKLLFTDPDRWEEQAIGQALSDERKGSE